MNVIGLFVKSLRLYTILLLCLNVASVSIAQNKTLGVGTATPNPNAAMHVESPSNNQGILIPRLTTLQRITMTASLGTADEGMLLFDTDLNVVMTWNGTDWNTGVGGSSNNANPAVIGTTTGTGSAVVGYITNSLNVTAAVGGSTNGTGVGLYGITTGTGAAIQGYTATGQFAIIGQNAGPGNGFAGHFSNTNASNTYPAIQTWTLGTGPGLRVLQGGGSLGGGVDVILQNPTTTETGVRVLHQGTGNAGNFYINNSNSGAPSLQVSTNGTGHGMYVETTNTINGTASALNAVSNSATAYAANFRNTNTGTTGGALYLVTYGSGGSVATLNHRGSGGSIVEFQDSDAKVARIDKTGKGFFNGGTQTGGADVAELFDIEGNKQNYEPGDVLVISEKTDRTVEKSFSPNSTKVAGVYATKPGVILTEKSMDENSDTLIPMGVVGVIPTKVCVENGVIRRGDLLVTASTPGYAMKAVSLKNDGIFPAGVIIGKALENFDGSGKHLINVLVNVK